MTLDVASFDGDDLHKCRSEGGTGTREFDEEVDVRFFLPGRDGKEGHLRLLPGSILGGVRAREDEGFLDAFGIAK
jgi:hypothetical protein